MTTKKARPNAASRMRAPAAARMKVRMWTPLPPRPSGIASYSHELLEEFARRCDLTVVSEEFDCPMPAGVEMLTVEQARANRDPEAMDLYQLGNNLDHEFIYRECLATRGVLSLHDGTLHHLIESITLGRGDEQGYATAMGLDYGQAGLTLALLRSIGVFCDDQRFSLTLNKTPCARAFNMVVHSKYIGERVAPMARKLFRIEHHVAPHSTEFLDLSQQEARAMLGIDYRGPIVLSLGFVTPPKRISSVLAALRLLKAEGLSFHYYIVGQRNPGYDLDAAIAENGLQDDVTGVGFAEESEFFRYIRAADVVTNLRFPSVGESSGTLARSMSLGTSCIVHDFGPMSEFPDDCVVKVPLEFGEPLALAQTLRRLLTSPAYREAIGVTAKRYCDTQLTVARSVDGYLAAVEDAIAYRARLINPGTAEIHALSNSASAATVD